METKENYAIVELETNEFYPFARRDKASIEKHIDYLINYQARNNMKHKSYKAEKLTKARMEQFDSEWNRFVSMID